MLQRGSIISITHSWDRNNKKREICFFFLATGGDCYREICTSFPIICNEETSEICLLCVLFLMLITCWSTNESVATDHWSLPSSFHHLYIPISVTAVVSSLLWLILWLLFPSPRVKNPSCGLRCIWCSSILSSRAVGSSLWLKKQNKTVPMFIMIIEHIRLLSAKLWLTNGF